MTGSLAGVLVDPIDAHLLVEHRWFIEHGYVRRDVMVARRRSRLYLHRVITGAPTGMHVDHINGNRLDNRRGNLRVVTCSENLQNRRGPAKHSRTQRRGVTLCPSGKYAAYVVLSRKKVNLGRFATLDEADAAAREGRRRYMTHSPERLEFGVEV